jgi:pimeloyl-ACP methyl ester carboxylesterase
MACCSFRTFFNILLIIPLLSVVFSTFFDFYDESPIFEDTSILSKQNMKFLKLNDGRIMEYFSNTLEKKPKNTILIFHDIYFTGKFCENYENFWRENEIQVICPSLPGWGYSDINNGTIQHYDEDIEQLLTHLKISQFSLFGIRMGAVYATLVAKSTKFKFYIEKLGLISPLRALKFEKNVVDFFNGVVASSDESTAHTFLTMRGISHLLGYLTAKYIKSNNFAFMEQVIPEDWTVMTHLKEKEFITNEMKRSIERSWKILALYLRWLTFEWNCEIQTEAEIFITSNSRDGVVSPPHQAFLKKCNTKSHLMEFDQTHYEIYSNFQEIIKSILYSPIYKTI